ncbi:MAG: hypothetical protein ACPG21_05205 [Crocinitomicaceae bacterium]
MKNVILSMMACMVITGHAQLSNNLPTTGAVSIGTATPAVGKQLTVNGNTIFYNGVETDGIATFNDQTKMMGVVRMDSLALWSGDADDVEILIIDPYGNVTRSTRGGLMAALLDPEPTANRSGAICEAVRLLSILPFNYRTFLQFSSSKVFFSNVLLIVCWCIIRPINVVIKTKTTGFKSTDFASPTLD